MLKALSGWWRRRIQASSITVERAWDYLTCCAVIAVVAQPGEPS
jgi:hypothetical protein